MTEETMTWNFRAQDSITSVLNQVDRAATAVNRALEQTANAARDLGRSATLAERPVDALGDEMGQAARQADDLADELDGVGSATRRLDRQMSTARARVVDLRQELARTGDVRLLGDIDEQQGVIKRLERVRQELRQLGDAGQGAGEGFLDGFRAAVRGLPSELKGTLILAAVGAAFAAAPAVGAAIGGAVAGVTGVGGIAGGIALAARDQRVKDAAAALADQVGAAFAHVGDPFVVPVVEGLDVLGDAVADFARADLGPALADIAPVVRDLSTGAAGLIREMGPGIADAIRNSAPAVRLLARELPELGDALGDTLRIMTESEGAVEGLAATLDVLEGVMVATGRTVKFLSDVFDTWVRSSAAMTGALEDVVGWVPLLGEHMRRSNDITEGWISRSDAAAAAQMRLGQDVLSVTDALDRERQSVADLSQKLGDLAGDTLSTQQAQLTFAEGLDRLSEAIRDNGTATDLRSESSRAVRGALLAEIAAADRAADAYERQLVAEGKEAGAAANLAAVYREQLLNEITKVATSLGVSKAALDELTAAFRDADGTTIRMFADIESRLRLTPAARNAGNTRIGERAFSAGGAVTGPGPRGVDSVAAALAPGEVVWSTDDVDRFGGTAAVDRMRRGGGAGAAAAAAGGGTDPVGEPTVIELRQVIVTPDGRTITEQVQRFGLSTGRRTLKDVFAMPAS